MRMRMECWILISKNSAKLKEYYYYQAEFLEVQYQLRDSFYKIPSFEKYMIVWAHQFGYGVVSHP